MDKYEEEILKEYIHSNIFHTVEVGKQYGSIDQQTSFLLEDTLKHLNDRHVKASWKEVKDIIIEVAEERGKLTEVDDSEVNEDILIDAVQCFSEGFNLLKMYFLKKRESKQ